MKITVDLNVLPDVAENRLPHFHASEEVLHRARDAEFSAVLPGHAITTLHYFIEKGVGTDLANQTVDGLLADFIVHAPDKALFQRARQLPIKDFEDAVVAAVAESTGSDYIVTRNVSDFRGSPIPAISPSEFLEEIAGDEVK